MQELMNAITNFTSGHTVAVYLDVYKRQDSGSSINSLLAGMEKEESIICVCTPAKGRLLTVSQSGMVKFTDFSELESRKQKIIACGLKAGDTLLLAEAEDPNLPNLLLITKKGM